MCTPSIFTFDRCELSALANCIRFGGTCTHCAAWKLNAALNISVTITSGANSHREGCGGQVCHNRNDNVVQYLPCKNTVTVEKMLSQS